MIPSAQVGRSEANKNKILRFMYGKGLKIQGIKDRGFARVELEFDNFHEANTCLVESVKRDAQREGIIIEIPSRAKVCRGVITEWDLGATLDELISAMVVSSNVKSLERMKRKIFVREERKIIEKVTHTILMTWVGNALPTEIRLYGGITGLRVRPYVDNVLQCYGCYRHGHLMKHCRVNAVCIACGEAYHGKCEKPYRCSNCGGRQSN